MWCCCCFQRIAEDEIGVIGRLGKFHGVAQPGFKCLLWPIDTIIAMVSMRAQQLDVQVETQTMDGFVVRITATVEYQPIKEKICDEFYELTDPAAQISTYVNDIIRGILPKLNLDQAFDSKEVISTKLKHQLEQKMEEFGYAITQGLVTGISTGSSITSSPSSVAVKETMDGRSNWKAGRAPTGAGDNKKMFKGAADDRKMLKLFYP